MKRIELAYLAGIMDADGFFTIKRSTYSIRVRKDSKNPIFYERIGIKQVTQEAIKIIHDNFGGCYRIEKPQQPNRKPLFIVELTNLKANNFINAIYPYLRIKKKQATILLNLRKSLKEGKLKKTKSMHKNRWGNITEFTRYSVSENQINYRESLITQLDGLNDIRLIKYSNRK